MGYLSGDETTGLVLSVSRLFGWMFTKVQKRLTRGHVFLKFQT